jgi:hypothetical protein
VMASHPAKILGMTQMQKLHHSERVVELISAARAWLREEPDSTERLRAVVRAFE